jgi:hypothetical protein
VLHAEEDAAEEDGDGDVEADAGDQVDRAASATDSRVVEHAVEPSESLDGEVDGGLEVGFLAHVHAQEDRILPEFVGQGIPSVLHDVRDHHSRPLFDEELGGCPANPAGRAGDDGDLSVEPCHSPSSSSAAPDRALMASIDIRSAPRAPNVQSSQGGYTR